MNLIISFVVGYLIGILVMSLLVAYRFDTYPKPSLWRNAWDEVIDPHDRSQDDRNTNH